MTPELQRAKSLAATEPDEALRICNDVLNREFDSEEAQIALFMSWFLMLEAERYGMAYNLFQRCAQLKPNQSEIYSNMGMCLEESDPQKAISLFKRALKLNKNNKSAKANMALMMLHTGRPDECIRLCKEVLQSDPESRSSTHNMGLAKLMKRDFTGWNEYYDTLGVKHREKKNYGFPDWEGQPGTVLVYGEQGVGDEIMFASCLADLAKTNKIIFDCDRRLESIFKRNFDFEIHGERFSKEPLKLSEKPDYQLAIGQLPYFYRQKESDFPGKPYLKPCSERAKQWEVILSNRPRIGVAWSGGTKGTREQFRSFGLDELSPLFGLDAEFINLQYKPVNSLDMEKYNITNWPRAVLKGCDLEDTLALISRLDCVVTCCTTVVYLAGALGVPCYVMVPKYCGYRYHNEGDTFPWYNSVKLFRGKFEKSIKEITEYVKDMHRIRPKGGGGLSRIVSFDPETSKQAS
jgi:hypothetical protein